MIILLAGELVVIVSQTSGLAGLLRRFDLSVAGCHWPSVATDPEGQPTGNVEDDFEIEDSFKVKRLISTALPI